MNAVKAEEVDVSEDIARTLGRIEESQRNTEQRLTRIESKMDDIVRLDVASTAHAAFDDERFAAHASEIQRAHEKVSELRRTVNEIEPPSNRKQAVVVGGATGAGAFVVWLLDHLTKR